MKKFLKSLPYIAIAILVGIVSVYAAPDNKLVPPGAPSNTMYSLTDIYNLASGTTTTEGVGDIQVTPPLTETGKTLTEVYTAISDEIAKLTPEVLLSGNTIFGVEGEVTAGPAELTWQTDPALNLCWSHNQYEIDNGCTVGSGFIQTPDTNTTLGAKEYCQYLGIDGTTLANTAQNIWRLPTIQEYQSITDFTKYNNATNVPGFAEGTGYWSSTEDAGNPVGAWGWVSWNGYTYNDNKSYQSAVRCAH